MLQNADDISKQLKKQDKNANIIAGILVIGVGTLAWATKIASLGGGLVLGGLSAAVFVSLWYFFQNIDDEESRRIYGVASILSIGILVSLVNYIWGDRIAEWIPGGIERTEQIFWTLWYLFMIAMMMIGTIRCVRRQRQKKEKKYKTVLFTGIMAAIMFATLWQYQNTMQGQRRRDFCHCYYYRSDLPDPCRSHRSSDSGNLYCHIRDLRRHLWPLHQGWRGILRSSVHHRSPVRRRTDAWRMVHGY